MTRRAAAACVAAAVSLVLLLAPAGAGASSAAGAGLPRATSPSYVALGDSYTSGPFIPRQTGRPAGCLRSDSDYPSLTAAALHVASFSDVSCQGAGTVNMTRPESVPFGKNPPQLDALLASTTLVTLQVGGNDIDFEGIVVKCAELSITDLFGAPCKHYYTAGGTDRLARAVRRAAPKVAAVLRRVHALAPSARVLLLGYPAILPSTGAGCWPEVPFAPGDVQYLRGVELNLNKMLAARAAAGGATFVNTYTASIGHDACEPSRLRWVEGLLPTSPAGPLHPNAAGERAMARQVLAAVR